MTKRQSNILFGALCVATVTPTGVHWVLTGEPLPWFWVGIVLACAGVAGLVCGFLSAKFEAVD